MIHSRLSDNEELTRLEKLYPEKFKKAFDFLKNSDLENLKDGRYEIENDKIKGDTIFANVQTLSLKPKEERLWEAHRKYIDIQYLIKGSEAIGYGHTDDFKSIKEEYNNKKDVIFFNDGSHFNYINLKKDEFVVFFPHDVHCPMLKTNKKEDSGKIKKVIVKIFA